MGLQASNRHVESSTQTPWNKKINKTTDTTGEKNFLQYDDDNAELLHFLNKSYILMEEALTANETIDIFMDDFQLNTNDDFRNAGVTELSIIKPIKLTCAENGQ